MLEEFQQYLYLDREVPSRPASLAEAASTGGGATTPATDVLAVIPGAEASVSEPIAAAELGPTPEQARFLAEQQRERDFAHLRQAE